MKFVRNYSIHHSYLTIIKNVIKSKQFLCVHLCCLFLLHRADRGEGWNVAGMTTLDRE